MRPRLPKWLREVGWRTLVGALLLGGIVHICATLAVPVAGSGHAYQRLRATLPLNRMVILPAPTPARMPLPFLSPDMLYAMCRYELTGGAVTVTAMLADAGWALSLHTPGGENFYVMPGQASRRDEVSFLVVPGGDRLTDVVLPPRRASAADTQVASPSTEGLIVVRAALPGLAWRAETEAMLKRASCTQVKR